MKLNQVIAGELDRARRRSLALLEPVTEADLRRQVVAIMSPLVWDLGHVGNYEEQWLLGAVAGTEPIDPALHDVYDAFRHPRPNRPALPLLDPPAARRYLGSVRARALDILESLDMDAAAHGRAPGRHPTSPALLAGGLVYWMVVQHEHQHDETMLATLALLDGDGYRPAAPAPPGTRGPVPEEVEIAAGPFVLGSSDEPRSYDNERPAHVVELEGFAIDGGPVTNRRYLEFVEDGGYRTRRWWTDDGWAWLRETGIGHPQFWSQDAGAWRRQRFGWNEALPADEPVQHVCWYEADAYARWRGRRLPTEAEWEKAASWGPDQRKRSWPWDSDGRCDWGTVDPDLLAGRANLGQRHFGPAAVGAFPQGASAYGVHQLLGDVWEWTASDFEPYPGFASYPYREYSEVFFGSGYKVLRGGSWATSPTAVRTTFRNWDLPVRRQIFAGFRTAHDL